MASVLHVSQPTEAGVGSYVAALCADQVERGWRVVLACPREGPLATLATRAGVRHEDWPAVRSPDPRTAAEVWRLRRVVERADPDVVHLHSAKAGLAGRLAVRGARPTLFQPHGWSWLAAPHGTVAAISAWERLAARWTARFVVLGPGEVRLARDCGLSGRYCVVPTGIDLRRFPPAGARERAAARARLALPADAAVAVCVGRVTRQKGQDLLLDAWPLVRRRRPDALLAVVGAGELAPPRRPAPPGVIRTGQVADTRPWYVAADVVVLPSRWEGVPLTLLEALATARPVVGHDVPGIADELPPDAGALVPVGDAAALADAVSRRLADPALAAAEGAAAARFAAARRDLSHTHDRLAAIATALAGYRVGEPGDRAPKSSR